MNFRFSRDLDLLSVPALISELRNFNKFLVDQDDIDTTDIRDMFHQIVHSKKIMTNTDTSVRMQASLCFASSFDKLAPGFIIGTTGELKAIFSLFLTVIPSIESIYIPLETLSTDLIEILIKTDAHLLLDDLDLTESYVECLCMIKSSTAMQMLNKILSSQEVLTGNILKSLQKNISSNEMGIYNVIAQLEFEKRKVFFISLWEFIGAKKKDTKKLLRDARLFGMSQPELLYIFSQNMLTDKTNMRLSAIKTIYHIIKEFSLDENSYEMIELILGRSKDINCNVRATVGKIAFVLHKIQKYAKDANKIILDLISDHSEDVRLKIAKKLILHDECNIYYYHLLNDKSEKVKEAAFKIIEKRFDQNVENYIGILIECYPRQIMYVLEVFTSIFKKYDLFDLYNKCKNKIGFHKMFLEIKQLRNDIKTSIKTNVITVLIRQRLDLDIWMPHISKWQQYINTPKPVLIEQTNEVFANQFKLVFTKIPLFPSRVIYANDKSLTKVFAQLFPKRFFQCLDYILRNPTNSNLVALRYMKRIPTEAISELLSINTFDSHMVLAALSYCYDDLSGITFENSKQRLKFFVKLNRPDLIPNDIFINLKEEEDVIKWVMRLEVIMKQNLKHFDYLFKFPLMVINSFVDNFDQISLNDLVELAQIFTNNSNKSEYFTELKIIKIIGNALKSPKTNVMYASLIVIALGPGYFTEDARSILKYQVDLRINSTNPVHYLEKCLIPVYAMFERYKTLEYKLIIDEFVNILSFRGCLNRLNILNQMIFEQYSAYKKYCKITEKSITRFLSRTKDRSLE